MDTRRSRGAELKKGDDVIEGVPKKYERPIRGGKNTLKSSKGGGQGGLVDYRKLNWLGSSKGKRKNRQLFTESKRNTNSSKEKREGGLETKRPIRLKIN